MMTRITITLSIQEKTALQVLATESLRSLKEELRFLLREEARRRGILTDQPLEEQLEQVSVEARKYERD
jgi:hypothetical protein